MPFDSSEIQSIDPGGGAGSRWDCTVVIFIVNGVAYSFCSELSHSGQGGLPSLA